jgi:hypothetical protein
MAFQLNYKLVLLLLAIALILSLYVAIKSKCSCDKCAAPASKEGFDTGASSEIGDSSVLFSDNPQYFG